MVAASSAPAAAPAQESSTAALVVPAPSPTLHSSDENYFYFCDP